MERDTQQKMKQNQPMQVSKIGTSDRVEGKSRDLTGSWNTSLGHLPLKLTLNTAPLKQRITVVKVPKPFPISEIGEATEEACSENAAELANEKSGEIEQALRDGHDDQAWSLVSTVAENYLEWRCSSSKGDRRKGGKGRCGEPKTKEYFLAASVGERSCDSPATKLTRKLKKSRRQAVEIQTKLNSRKAEEIDTRMQIVQLWSKIKKTIEKNRVPCQPIVQVFVSSRTRCPVAHQRDASNDQENRQGGRRAKNQELAQQNDESSQQKNKLQGCKQRLEGALKFHQERESSTDHCSAGIRSRDSDRRSRISAEDIRCGKERNLATN